MTALSTTVIIPALNEAECIADVITELRTQPEVDEILVVDGHSTDGTADIVRRLGVRVALQEGRGYGMAMQTGLKQARGEVIIPLDADGSYDPKDIRRLLACIANGYDVAFASRYLPQSGSHDDTPIRYVGNKMFTFLLRLVHGVNISDSLFLYVAARKTVFEQLNLNSAGFEYCIEFPIKVRRAGLSYTEVPSFERKRIAGDSKVNAMWDGLRILGYMLRWRFKA